MTNLIEHKAKTGRFIKAFNTNDWDAVREVVAPNFVLHHPLGGDLTFGAEGMVAVWAEFKASVPDAWHPIPIMIAEGDYVAVLLPTYGHFDGVPHKGVQPTGEWLEYGMVNIVRFHDGRMVEGWFGMDPLVEMQQMHAVPPPQLRELSTQDELLLLRFQSVINPEGRLFDSIEVFGNVVVAMGPPQAIPGTSKRAVDIYRQNDDTFDRIYAHTFATNPPFGGTLGADTELTKAVMKQYYGDVLSGHDLDVLIHLVSEDVLVHPTAMPCEASFYGIMGLGGWLSNDWRAFPDLRVTDQATVVHGDLAAVRWEAEGTSRRPYLGIPPTGETVRFAGVSMYRLDHGKIAEVWEARDALAIIHQMDPLADQAGASQ